MGVCWKIWWVLFMVYLRHVYVVVYGVVTMKISWSYINNIHQHSIYTVINDWEEVCFFPLLFDECTGTRIPPKLGWKKSNLRCSWYPGILWLTWLIFMLSWYNYSTLILVLIDIWYISNYQQWLVRWFWPLLESDSCTTVQQRVALRVQTWQAKPLGWACPAGQPASVSR